MLAKLITTVTPVTEETTLGAVTAKAPDLAVLVDLAVPVLEEILEVTVVTLLAVAAALVTATAGVLAADTPAAEVLAGTVATALIAASTVELKVPVIPSRSNFAEKAVKGSAELVVDLRAREMNLMNHTAPCEAPIDGVGTKVTWAFWLTSRDAETSWRQYWVF